MLLIQSSLDLVVLDLVLVALGKSMRIALGLAVVAIGLAVVALDLVVAALDLVVAALDLVVVALDLVVVILLSSFSLEVTLDDMVFFFFEDLVDSIPEDTISFLLFSLFSVPNNCAE